MVLTGYWACLLMLQELVQVLLSSFLDFLLCYVEERLHIPHPAQESQSVVKDVITKISMVETSVLSALCRVQPFPFL